MGIGGQKKDGVICEQLTARLPHFVVLSLIFRELTAVDRKTFGTTQTSGMTLGQFCYLTTIKPTTNISKKLQQF